MSGQDLNETYYEELRLSREFMRLLSSTDDKIYLHKESRKAYDALLEHYQKQMEEGVQ